MLSVLLEVGIQSNYRNGNYCTKILIIPVPSLPYRLYLLSTAHQTSANGEPCIQLQHSRLQRHELRGRKLLLVEEGIQLSNEQREERDGQSRSDYQTAAASELATVYASFISDRLATSYRVQSPSLTGETASSTSIFYASGRNLVPPTCSEGHDRATTDHVLTNHALYLYSSKLARREIKINGFQRVKFLAHYLREIQYNYMITMKSNFHTEPG